MGHTNTTMSKENASKVDLPSKKYLITQDYEVTKNSLGIGVNGKVVECRNKRTGKIYALKALRDNYKARREVSLHLKAISCPYIVKIEDIFENNFNNFDCLLIVMECMTGGELFSAIEERGRTRSSFTEREAAGLIRNIALAVHYLHERNIAHRDLKPENLLFADKSTNSLLKLTDFGFAKETNINNKTLQTPCYTPYYVAPEVLGTERYDKSCDLWSLGVITYILLCGYPPFYSNHGLAISPGMKKRIKNAHYRFPPSDWDKITKEAKDLVSSLLKAEPEKRLTIEGVLNHPWIRQFDMLPETELDSARVLMDEKEQWPDVQEAMNSALNSMRVEPESAILKPLSESRNSLLHKRKNKMSKLAAKQVAPKLDKIQESQSMDCEESGKR